MPFPCPVTTVEQLRRLYRPPTDVVRAKQIDHLDAGARAFVAASPLVLVATGSADGSSDLSPRGGPPGFVAVLDDHRLVLGDLSGNNRLDTLENLVVRPGIGLLFVVPGLGETLRVNGRATVTTDPEVRASAAIDGRTPRVAIGVEVDECYVHCAKAFRRSSVWDPSTWPSVDDRPSPARMLRDHTGIEVDPALIEQALEDDYVATLWLAGGSDPE